MTSVELKIGGKYNWKNQPERLVFIGSMPYPKNGTWFQFAKVDSPNECWSEVRASDLQHFEESK